MAGAFAAANMVFLGSAGLPTDLGLNGFERLRLVGDGTADLATIVVPATSTIKVLLGVVGAQSDVPTAGRTVDGVASTIIGPVAPIPAAGRFIDLLLYGRGR